MTNFEKYKDDLMKIEGNFAFDKVKRRVIECGTDIDCEDCIFNGNCFEDVKIKWLYKEYESPVLSDDELELINILSKINGKEYKYVARDAYGVIRLFETKPSVNKTGHYSGCGYTYIDIGFDIRLEHEILFSNITHKDGLYDIENKCFIKR